LFTHYTTPVFDDLTKLPLLISVKKTAIPESCLSMRSLSFPSCSATNLLMCYTYYTTLLMRTLCLRTLFRTALVS
jgi:hypothetical protein